MSEEQSASVPFRASFISTISKFSGDRSGRLGINIPANIKSQFPLGLKVKVMVEEIVEGTKAADFAPIVIE